MKMERNFSFAHTFTYIYIYITDSLGQLSNIEDDFWNVTQIESE